MWSSSWSHRRLPAEVVDRLIALSLLVWALFDVPWWWRPPGHDRSTPVILALVAAAAAQSVPFLWRRSRPVAVLGPAAVCLATKAVAGLNVWSAGGAVLAAAYGLGAYGGAVPRTVARWSAAFALATAVVLLSAVWGDHGPALVCALAATALGMGEAAASHRDVAAADARHARDLERAAIAREIHDLVAHQLSAIAVQSGAARLASVRDPAAAQRAVVLIEREARRGMAELNHLVATLRRGQPVGTAPASGWRLADIPQLVERARRSGLRAEFVVDGEPHPLPDDTELAGYRVAQEGLTNAIRYAAGARARVCVAYREDGVMVEVADDGPGAATSTAHEAGGGLGLAGLTERISLLGGRLDAAPLSGGGFRLRAFLPGAS